MSTMTIVFSVVFFAVGFLGALFFKQVQAKKKRRSAQQEADRIVNKAKSNASRIEREAKNRGRDQENKIRRNAERDIQKQKQNLKREEQSLKDQRAKADSESKRGAEKLKQRANELKAQQEKIDIAEKRLRDLETQAHQKLKELTAKLENVSSFSADDARKELVKSIEEEARHDAARKITLVEEEAKEDAENKAKRIVSLAVNRYAGEYTAERVVSVVPLTNDEMKGKIIGREGRNIRALESACGVDLIVDETPEAVVISGFDPVRREIAKRTLEQLMEDGRVHPSRIEEIVHKVKKLLFKSILEDGEKACFELGVVGVNKEILKLIGSLRYRTSFTQNNYVHSLEVGHMCGMMAAEMGIDITMARRAGLLHDIGKALDHSIEGSHAVIGADFAKKHGENETICHAIRAHHEDEKPNTVLAHLVAAADAISSARPGARKSTMETYVRRLEDLESIGNSFDGVLRTFAVQAGRELRVIVESSKVTDEQSVMLSRDIARKIEREMNFPGQIKVTVIRETRAVEHAR